MAEGESSGTATVLFTDLVGSTASRARLGEEAAEALRKVHDRLVNAAIESKGGKVVKHLGDGVMATFASAADALSAAVAAQQALARHNRSGDAVEHLGIRIGLSAGDVVFEGGDVFGTPVIEASRLCGAARGGQVLASEVVRLLAGSWGGHRFTPVGALELKGFADPVAAVEVGWTIESAAVPMPVALVRPGSFRFVGRQGEAEAIARLGKEAAAGGEARVVFVAGEAGVGKTRLVSEVARQLHREGASVLFGRCDEDLGVPYQPFAEALSEYTAAAAPEDLARQLGPLGGERAGSYRGSPGGWPGSPHRPRRSPRRSATGSSRRCGNSWLPCPRQRRSCSCSTTCTGRPGPPCSCSRHLARHPEGPPDGRRHLPGHRPGPGHPLAEVLADLRRLAGTERIALTGLDQAGVVAFVRSDRRPPGRRETCRPDPGGLGARPRGTRSSSARSSGTSPRPGRSAEVDGRWQVIRPLAEVGLPEGVREVVGRRLTRLSPVTNEVLATAAVIGREFDVGLLADAVDAGARSSLAAIEEAEGPIWW